MKPLDPGQRRELEYVLGHGSGVHLSSLRRALTAFCLAAAGGSAFAFFVALADGPWLPLGLLLFAVYCLCLLPGVLAPVRAAEWGVRFFMQSEESVKRGERGRHWPR